MDLCAAINDTTTYLTLYRGQRLQGHNYQHLHGVEKETKVLP